jgi:metal-responsive CopG/Arc/MetJ family transcriptional regulator
MNTISVSLDEDTIRAVGKTAENMGMSPSSFIQYALKLVLGQHNIKELEEKHRQGYISSPVNPGEFDDWEDEQVWGD